MSNVIPFNFNGKKVRTIKDEDGGVWIVAADICDNLDLKSHKGSYAHHLSKLDEDEKALVDRSVFYDTPLPDMGVIGEGFKRFFNVEYVVPSKGIWLVNEAGAYILTMRSDKKIAKQFRKWLAHEVIPSIRKTGSYHAHPPSTLIPAAKEFHAAIRIARVLGLERNQAILSANHAVRRITGTDCLEVMQITHLESESHEQHLTPSDIGVQLGGLSPQKVNKLLHSLGFQEPFRDKKNRLKWSATEKGKPNAILKDTGKKHTDGTPVLQTFWKKSVVEKLKVEVSNG